MAGKSDPDNAAERVYTKDRQEWRAWLEQNHATAPGVWLIYYKKETGKPYFDHGDAVEEALCFGWIDSVRNTNDDESYLQFFSPRKAKSPWSKLNKTRVEMLIAEGLMTPAGLEKIEIAKQNGAWASYDAVEELTVPNDLAAALSENETARVNFEAFSPSSKKSILWWIESAKRPETRAKRIEETVRLAAENIRANQSRQ
ncbi:MAG TPA: YdeI/OmpD-associated family protein [Phototrophicaceae bacterium]|jgi:uncharacterized protein YdeI (YjbR/CyaY-like superfamily)|nr:YdeI/OmpD-associated family protein [Phototrophicaceae bacterium]